MRQRQIARLHMSASAAMSRACGYAWSPVTHVDLFTVANKPPRPLEVSSTG